MTKNIDAAIALLQKAKIRKSKTARANALRDALLKVRQALKDAKGPGPDDDDVP
jgi:hypothetical protein